MALWPLPALVFSSSASNMLLTLILSSAVIASNSTTFTCDGVDECSNTHLYCTDHEECFVYCSHSSSCYGLTITTPSKAMLTVYCDRFTCERITTLCPITGCTFGQARFVCGGSGYDHCENTRIPVPPSNMDFDVLCIRPGVCKSAIINCPTDADCYVKCNRTSACQNACVKWPTNSSVTKTRICQKANSCTNVPATGSTAECPTRGPTSDPTIDPTVFPTMDPTSDPTSLPTSPTIHPTYFPTMDPTTDPTIDPTLAPSLAPTQPPSLAPSFAPTVAPSWSPTSAPTTLPSAAPTLAPSIAPSIAPTQPPSMAPTLAPSIAPTLAPSFAPTLAPSIAPTMAPTLAPSIAPSFAPTLAPSLSPTSPPSVAPSVSPTAPPTLNPTGSPTYCFDAKYRGKMFIDDVLWSDVDNDLLVSENCRCKLDLLSNGNLVIYERIRERNRYTFAMNWQTNATVNNVTGESVAKFGLNSEGVMVVTEYGYKYAPFVDMTQLWTNMDTVINAHNTTLVLLDECCLEVTNLDNPNLLRFEVVWTNCIHTSTEWPQTSATEATEQTSDSDQDTAQAGANRYFIKDNLHWIWIILLVIALVATCLFCLRKRNNHKQFFISTQMTAMRSDVEDEQATQEQRDEDETTKQMEQWLRETNGTYENEGEHNLASVTYTANEKITYNVMGEPM